MDAGYRQLCTRCFNAVVSELHGLDDFENIQLEPIGLIDCTGEEHKFNFRTRLLGDIVSLEAFELREGNPSGYEFQLIGDPDEDLFVLLGRLIKRIAGARTCHDPVVEGGEAPLVPANRLRLERFLAIAQ